MIKEFTLRDLSDGMVVETKCGKRYLVYCGRFIGETGYNILDSYDNDLTANHYLDDPYTIVKVYRIPREFIIRTIRDFLTDTSVRHYTLIWEREERRDMTLEEIENKLGYKINLIDNTKE